MKSLFENIFSYPSALVFVLKNKLSKYFIYSGIVSILLAVGLGSMIYIYSDNLANIITSFYPFEFGKEMLANYSWIFTGGIMAILAFIVYKNLLLAFIGPLMGPLSEKIEWIETGIEPENQGIGKIGYQTIRGIRLAIRNIFFEILLTIFMLVIGLFPLISPITPILILIVQAYYIGFGNYDYHWEKYLSFSESVQLGRNNRLALIGNGAGFMLILLIPIIGLFLAPVLGAVVATRYALRS